MANLIVAYDKNGVIGIENELPWKQSADLKRVKELTVGNKIIMGYMTYLSLPKALPNRTNYVLSDYNLGSDEFTETDFEPFNKDIKSIKDDDSIFVFGGGRTYQKLLPYVNKMYVTLIDTEIKSDKHLTYFPKFNKDDWEITYESDWQPSDENNEYPYKFIEYSRKQ